MKVGTMRGLSLPLRVVGIPKLKSRSTTTAAILENFDSFILDMDGVLWNGPTPIRGSIEALNRLSRSNKNIYFLTNNSSKTRGDLVKKLETFGFNNCNEENIITSSLVTASVVKDAGHTCVYLVGSDATRKEFEKKGITVLTTDRSDHVHISDKEIIDYELDPRVSAVIVSWDRDFTFRKLCIATSYLSQKHKDIALYGSNVDSVDQISSNGKVVVAAGPLIHAIERATGKEAHICGKPDTAIINFMKQKITKSTGVGSDAVMVGDRLDTDISFANIAGLKSCLVLTGCTSIDDVKTFSKNPIMKPTFIANNLDDFVNLILSKNA